MEASGGAGRVRARVLTQDGTAAKRARPSVASKESAAASPFMHVAAANLVTAGALWLLLDPKDANALRRTHSLVRDALAEVPWHRVRTPVRVAGTTTAVRRFAAAYPAATCALRLTLSARTNGAALAAALPRRVTRLTLDIDPTIWAASRATAKTVRALPPRVTELALYLANRDDYEEWWEAVSFSHLPALTALRCALSGISSRDIATLPPSLTLLDMRRCTDLGAAVTFAHLPALCTLNCEATSIDDAAIASLPHSITQLNIQFCSVTPAVTFAHLPALQMLTCAFTRVSNAAIASLSPTVRELHMAWCDNVTAAITFAHMPALGVLDATGTAVGDAALVSLPPSMTKLRVGGVGGEGAGVLTPAATLHHLPALTYVACSHLETAAALLDTLPHHARGRQVTKRAYIAWTAAAESAESTESDADSDAESDAESEL